MPTNERELSPKNEIERYVQPITLENPHSLDGLALVGLSPEFPLKLRKLNDVLAEHPTQFSGIRITLSPQTEDPITSIEVKRRKHRLVVVDIDAYRHDPTQSTGDIKITDMYEVDPNIVTQRLVNIQSFLKTLYGDEKKLTLHERRRGKKSDLVTDDERAKFRVTTDLPIISDDFLRLSHEEWNQLNAIYDYEVYEERVESPLMVFNVPPPGSLKERLAWVQEFIFSGTAGQIEDAVVLATEFCAYDPDVDPELFPPENA